MTLIDLHFVVMASRKEQKAALRAERERLEAERAAAAARKRLVAIIAGSLVALGALGAIIAVAMSGGDGEDTSAGGDDAARISFPDGGSVPEQREADLEKAAEAAGCKTANPQEEGSGHVETPVTYKSNPPHSGEHHPVPAEDALYDEEQAKEPLVHSLEHGRIVVWVNPSADEEFLGQVKALYEADPYHVIVTPDPSIPGPVAASAWTHTLTCDRTSGATFDAIRAFKDEWRDKGPEFVP